MVHQHDFFNFFNIRLYGFLFVLAVLLLYLKNHNVYTYAVPFTMLGITFIVTYAFHTLISMAASFTDFARFAIVITLAGAWLADSGAYFAGTFFGNRKLCPEISPKKTVEGVVGGTICNGVFLLIIAAVYTKLNTAVNVNLVAIFFAGMVCSLIGLVGDLSASVIKRQAKIKDYGNIMPGHGGVMDRFDSVLLVAPFMYYLFMQGCLVAF
jgi:phosphatidate cytidylyltransferase